MASQFCIEQLDRLTQLVRHYGSFMQTLCVLNLFFALVAVLENLLVIRALWKASSIQATVKKLFVSLAFSDLAVGMFVQPMYGVIIAAMLKMASTGNYNFVSFCPTFLTVFGSLYFLSTCASFLNVTAIAVDRLLAISLHLRYQQLVTSRRVIIGVASLWLTSGIAASMSVLLTFKSHAMVAMITLIIGLLLTSVANVRIYQVVRHHQNQIQCQLQLQMQNAEAMELLRRKKSTHNTLFVYAVFLACYLPSFIPVTLIITDGSQIAFHVASEASLFLVFLNSSLNPLVYCWRYQEIREIVRRTVKKIFRMSENGT